MKKIIVLFSFILLLGSCGQKTVFKDYHRFDNISWDRFDILNFNVDVQKDEKLDFDLLLRHHTNYPYDYLDVNITFYTPSGASMSRDYHFKLKNKDGSWKSDGLGDFWDIELPIRNEMLFSESGICKVRIENKMTKINTPGIIEVGLKAQISN